jgi:hypothetical protein
LGPGSGRLGTGSAQGTRAVVRVEVRVEVRARAEVRAVTGRGSHRPGQSQAGAGVPLTLRKSATCG